MEISLQGGNVGEIQTSLSGWCGCLYSQCIYRITRASVSLVPRNGDTGLSKVHEHVRDKEPHVDVICFP